MRTSASWEQCLVANVAFSHHSCWYRYCRCIHDNSSNKYDNVFPFSILGMKTVLFSTSYYQIRDCTWALHMPIQKHKSMLPRTALYLHFMLYHSWTLNYISQLRCCIDTKHSWDFTTVSTICCKKGEVVQTFVQVLWCDELTMSGHGTMDRPMKEVGVHMHTRGTPSVWDCTKHGHSLSDV